jgi:long-chain fatty acid transport protein
VNRAMAGAGVAAPIDAAGALLWNPAAVSGLAHSEFLIGLELLDLTNHVSSTAGPFTGETRSDAGVNALPTVAVAFQPQDSPWSFGLGMFSIGGFGANYPGGGTDPIFAPPPGGMGPVYSKLAVLQLVPTAAYRVTERLAIGFAPTVVVADVALDPDGLATPSPAGYPSATHTRTHWGLGFQAGIYYETESQWRFGASYKSPQWLEGLTFYDANPTGLPLTLKADYPGIISVGTAYYGLPRTVCAVDVRYIDYANTDLFGDDSGYDATGAMTGLGWRSVVSVAMGVQYELTDKWTIRGGYVYTQNPIRDADAFFNVAAPAVYQQIVAVGATWKMTCRTSLSLAYLHAFENSIAGPWNLPGVGPVPGTSVEIRQSIDALVAGMQVRF